MFDFVSTLVGGLLGKLGPVGALVPMLLGTLQTKIAEHDIDGIRNVAMQFIQAGQAFVRLGETLLAAIDPEGPGGTAVNGTEYTALSAEVLKVGDELVDITQAVKGM